MRKLIALILAFCMVSLPMAFAEEQLGFPKISGQGIIGKSSRHWGTIYVDDLVGTSNVDATNITDVVRYFNLPLGSFIISDATLITSESAPGYEIDDAMSNIVWADNEETPILTTFRIPADYASGGAFKVIATESGTSTPNQIDFDVYVNADGVVIDSSASDQTPVALAGTSSTPDEVTLTVSGDFSTLAAGKWVTLRIWRDNTATGTNDLEVKGVSFYYTATQ